MYTASFLLALGLVAQQVTATGWGNAPAFSCPGNTPTTCSSEQSSGFQWSGINPGQSISSHGGCGFSGGWSCAAQGPGGSLKHKRGGHGGGANFQDKCATAKISGPKESCPSIHAGQGSGSGDTMSPTHYGVSCSYDTQVDMEYTMKDGSTCRHTSPCMQAGNTIENTQCGGAVSVKCSQNEGEKSKNKGDCSIGVHTIGFHCGPSTSITPPKTPPTPPAQPPPQHSTDSKPVPPPNSTPTPPESTPAQPPPSTAHTTNTGGVPPYQPPASSSPPATQATPSTPGSSPPPSNNGTVPVGSAPPSTAPVTTPVASSTPITTTFLSTSTAFVTTEITVISCAPEITNCPAESKTPMVITKTLSQYTTICPVTATMIPGESTMKPSTATTPEASSSPIPPPSQPSNMPGGCPDVVPSCISTLLQSVQTECNGNGDSSCFCSVANHTQFIQSCITSHGATNDEIQKALSFFQGLCAPQVPQNPSIITHQPGGQPQQPICPPSVPATTITVHYTSTVTPTGTAPAATSVITTQSVVTVPQVQITTAAAPAPGASQPAVGLAPGAGTTTAAPPAPPPAAATPPAVPNYGAPASAPASPPSAPAAAPSSPATTPAAAAAPSTPAAGVASNTGVVAATNTGAISPPIQSSNPASKMGVSFGAVAVAAALFL